MFYHQEQKKLPFPIQDVFDIVLDVEHYPTFLPWVSHVKTYQHHNDDFFADLTIGYQWLTETYTSKVSFEKYKYVRAEHIKGPFNDLITHWKFQDLKTECEISFNIAFSLKSSLFQSMIEGFFKQACQKILEAFEKRAYEVLRNPR